jgi:hypothetical protein
VIVGPTGKSRTGDAETGRFEEGSEAADDEDAFGDWSAGDGAAFDGMLHEWAELEPGEREAGSRHKSLYRRIALLLHPDLAGVLTKQELELWYQAQRAYEERDVVVLETILARCDRVGTNSRTLSELRSFVEQANSRWATLRLSVAGLAQLPSWRFLVLGPSEMKARLTVVRHELEGVIRGLEQEASMLEDGLARIAERAERWVRRRQGAQRQLALGI